MINLLINIRSLLLCLICLHHPHLFADNTLVAVAANFTHVMRQIKTAFEADTPHTITLTFAASGKLYAQIKHGAPFDVLFSADQDKPQRLINEKLALPESLSTYACGRLALMPSKPFLSLQHLSLKNLSLKKDASAKLNKLDAKTILSGNQFNKLALANPAIAPYGAAAITVLQQLGLVELTRDKWILGENVNQAYQFVYSGSADMGLVALSQLIPQGKTQIKTHKKTAQVAWAIPANLHDPIYQDVVLLQHGRDNAAAVALLKYIKTEKVQKLIGNAGYDVPKQSIIYKSSQKYVSHCL